MKILLDGRLYGLENAGLGRYLINLVAELSKLDVSNEYAILLRKKYFEELKLPSNWQKVMADFRHYSLKEQLELPGIINKIDPDITHFPHFNVPILYSGKYVITIHDMLMHEFNGLSATTLPEPIYFLKLLAYKLVFATAIKKAIKIIVPSKAVKSDLLSHYKIDFRKVEVIYEG